MIVVTELGTTDGEVREIVERLALRGLKSHVLRVGPRAVVHVTSGSTRRAKALGSHPRVLALVPTSGPRIRREGRRFYPYHSLRAAAAGMLLVGLLVALAGSFPPALRAEGLAADAAVAAWPWYVAPLRGVLNALPDGPAWVGPTVLLVLALAALVLPAIDGRGVGERSRLPLLAVGSAVLVAVVFLALRTAF